MLESFLMNLLTMKWGERLRMGGILCCFPPGDCVFAGKCDSEELGCIGIGEGKGKPEFRKGGCGVGNQLLIFQL